jgi:hypothetical protein
VELSSPRRARRTGRPVSSSFSEEGISYEVREVSEGDLASIRLDVGTPDTSTPVTASSTHSDAPASEMSSSGGWDGPVDEAFVNVGREDGIRTSDLHEALSTAGVSQDDTAYVRIRQRHTFIGVRQGLLDQVVSGLSGQTIAQRSVEAQPARPRQARR